MNAVKYTFKLSLPAGCATIKPPIGTVLGPCGVNIIKFCNDFNKTTKELKGKITVGVFVYENFDYDIVPKEEIDEYLRTQFNESISFLYRNQEITSKSR